MRLSERLALAAVAVLIFAACAGLVVSVHSESIQQAPIVGMR